MHGEGFAGQLVAHRRRQLGRAGAQRLAHARRRLAGGRRQHDAGVRLLLEQAGQQPCHGGGLAGARPTADDGEPLAQRQRRGELLPVEARGRCGLAPEQRLQPVARGGADRLRRPRSQLPQPARQPLLVVVVAVQVQPPAGIQHQRPRARRGRRTDHAGREQLLAQALRRHLARHLRERHAGIARAGGQAHFASSPRCRRRGFGAGARLLRPALHVAGEGGRQAPRCGGAGQLVVAVHRGSPRGWPSMASSACTSAGAGRSKCTPSGRPSAPCHPGRTPRTNR